MPNFELKYKIGYKLLKCIFTQLSHLNTSKLK